MQTNETCRLTKPNERFIQPSAWGIETRIWLSKQLHCGQDKTTLYSPSATGQHVILVVHLLPDALRQQAAQLLLPRRPHSASRTQSRVGWIVHLSGVRQSCGLDQCVWRLSACSGGLCERGQGGGQTDVAGGRQLQVGSLNNRLGQQVDKLTKTTANLTSKWVN